MTHSPRRELVTRGLVALLALAAAAVTVAIVRGDPSDSLAGDSASVLTLELAAGLLLVAAGLIVRAPTAFRVLLVATGIAWLAVEWNSPGAGAAFSAGLVVYAAWPALLAHAVLRRGGETNLLERVVLILAYVDTLLLMGLAAALFFDPVRQGCLDCPVNQLLISAELGLAGDLTQVGLVLAAVWTAGFVALVAARMARTNRARCLLELPVALPAAVAVALFGLRALHGRERGSLSNDPTDRLLWIGQAFALALVAAGLVWERIRARRMRRQLTRLVVEMGESPPPGGLRERLAATLGDPSLELLHALGDGGGWVDGDGRRAEIPTDPGREVTRLLAGGEQLSAVVHRPGLLEQPGMAAELSDSARLALEHERLNAIRLAHLEGLRASRARIVASADAERRSLERDLHDGAQQRLATLAVSIRLARRRLGSANAPLELELEATEEGVRLALVELRELAHGLIPSVLAHEGLRPAVEALADRSSRLVVGELPSRRFTAPVESAAYFLVAETLRRSRAGDVAVSARCADGRLLIEVGAGGGIADGVVDIEDRVGALGGRLTVTEDDLRAELPCES